MQASDFMRSGFGFRISDSVQTRVCSFGFRVQASWFRVQGCKIDAHQGAGDNSKRDFGMNGQTVEGSFLNPYKG